MKTSSKVVDCDCDIVHEQVFPARYLAWNLSTYYFPVACEEAEDHCARPLQEKDWGGEVVRIEMEEENVVVMEATLVEKEVRTSQNGLEDQNSLDMMVRNFRCT